MFFYREKRIIAGHARSVICNLDKILAAIVRNHSYLGRTRIKGIIQELSHNCVRTLYHLAGGNLFRNLRRERDDLSQFSLLERLGEFFNQYFSAFLAKKYSNQRRDLFASMWPYPNIAGNLMVPAASCGRS
jgi:hypothetical protein